MKKYKFYDSYENPKNKGIKNEFEMKIINGETVVIDKTTELMWQQSGSNENFGYQDAEIYIQKLNNEEYAGYNDWRLPTVEEALSLNELNVGKNDLHLNDIFDKTQKWIWTADKAVGNKKFPISLDFERGCIELSNVMGEAILFVKAVRSLQ